MPPFAVTGGPELLHQLCSTLNGKAIHSLMYYPSHEGDGCPVEYKGYNTDYAKEIIDSADNYLIIPETKITSFFEKYTYTPLKNIYGG